MARAAVFARAASVAAVTVVALLLAPAETRAQVTADTTLFSVTSGTSVFTVNRLSGATTLIGTLSVATSGLARNPNTGLLYYASNAGTLGQVGTFNPGTGATSVINATGNGDLVARMAFDASGVLYAIGNAPGSLLYTIDPVSGAYTTLGPVRINSTAGAALGGNGDMAFDFDGKLYVIASDATNGGASLYRLSLSPSGGVYVATFIANSVPSGAQHGLAFVADGRLVSGGVNNTMYVINKTTGAATLIPGATAQYADFASSPRFADLSITGSTAGLPRGDTASFAITVSNAGPQVASGPITVVDTMPSGLTFQRATGAGWSCSAAGQIATCVMAGSLGVGASVPLTIYANVGTVKAGNVLTSILRVTGSTNDQDPSDNRITVAGTVVADVDFVLTKSHAGNFTVGLNGVYTISFTNTGAKPSVGTMTVVDTLPTGMTYVSGTGTSWTCSATGAVPDIVTCTRTVALLSNAATTITLTVAVATAAAPSRTNTVALSGGGSLTVTIASDPTTILFRAVTITPPSAAVSQLPSNGTSYTATYTVTNTGTLADSYTLTATRLPGTTLSITSVNGTAGTTAPLSLAVGANAVVSVIYTVANAALAGAVDTLALSAVSTASATVASTGKLTVSVIRAGLAIVKSMYRSDGTTLITATDQVSPGETVQFLVTVSATGNAGTTLVHVTDPLPGAVTYLSATGDLAGWTITQAGGTVTADLAGTLAAGASRFFWIKVKVQ